MADRYSKEHFIQHMAGKSISAQRDREFWDSVKFRHVYRNGMHFGRVIGISPGSDRNVLVRRTRGGNGYRGYGFISPRFRDEHGYWSVNTSEVSGRNENKEKKDGKPD